MDTSKITRVEVIDHHDNAGRAFVFGPNPTANVIMSVQDDGRTLKVFIGRRTVLPKRSGNG